MKLLRRIFNQYTRFFKITTTAFGTIFIYIFGIGFGKLTHLLLPRPHPSKWSDYQTGSSPSKMY